MFSSLLSTTGELTITQILICSGTAIVLGLLVAIVHMYKNTYTKNFIITLAVLPVLVQAVIVLVNGNLGAGVAVAGAFSLIRFRSVAGGSREITSIFWSMVIGLAAGMGYVVYVAILSIATAILLLILHTGSLGGHPKQVEKQLRITIPENLDYTDIFDDIFKTYTTESVLTKVKTTNMGSLYELTYLVRLKNMAEEKSMLDELRYRNGNLTIISSKKALNTDEL